MVKEDLVLTEFLSSHKGNEMVDKLDPSNLEYSVPDYGFNNFLEFADDEENGGVFGWRKFMDCVSM